MQSAGYSPPSTSHIDDAQRRPYVLGYCRLTSQIAKKCVDIKKQGKQLGSFEFLQSTY